MKLKTRLEILTPKEISILKELYNTYKKHVSLYLDLAGVLSDWAPEEIKKIVFQLEERKLIEYLPSQDQAHYLCRITPLGIESYRGATFSKQFKFSKKYIIYAGLVAILGLVTFGYQASKDPSKSFASITGRGLNEKTKAILTEWIEIDEEENSDNYTFDLLEEWEGRKTYFVECKIDHIHECKYNIVFVDVDEEKGIITNVEMVQE